MIEDKQCTIVWHVDDPIISRQKFVDNIINLLELEFVKESPLTVLGK
jgi:hypothetical protein